MMIGSIPKEPADLFDLLVPRLLVLGIDTGHGLRQPLRAAIQDQWLANTGAGLLFQPGGHLLVLLRTERAFHGVHTGRPHAVRMQAGVALLQRDRQAERLLGDLERVHAHHAIPRRAADVPDEILRELLDLAVLAASPCR
jgi:hypothetical protein